MYLLTSFIAAVLLLCLNTGCTKKETGKQHMVVVSIEPYRYFTSQIGGDKVNVTTLVPKGSSPETYEPTAKQMLEVAQSELYLQIGSTTFERTWTERFLQNSDRLKTIDTSKGLAIISNGHGDNDPHIWMSFRNAQVIAKNICEALCDMSPSDSSFFQNRLEVFLQKIKKQDLQAQQKTAHLTHRSFLIYHPALTYFARDYHLHQLSIEQDGKEPSARQLAQLISTAKANEVKVMLVQQEFANRNNQVIEQALHIKPVTINPLSYDWDKELLRTAQSISQGK